MPVLTERFVLPCDLKGLTADDGTRLLVRHYRPANGSPERTLLWCHGVGEHGGRYDHIVAEFLARGWQVIIPDLRGHGRSEGVRVDVAAFEDYLRDFDSIVRCFSLDPARTALFGNSMGALVMTRFAQTRPDGWAALTMSAPLLGISVPIPTWKLWLGRLLACIAPRTHLRTGIREENLTTDPTFQASRRADPLIQRAVTARWFFAMQAALRQAHAEAGTLTLPILILQGLLDATTDPRVPAAWLQRTGSSRARLIEFPEGLHALLHDREWESICTTMLDWLDDSMPREKTDGA